MGPSDEARRLLTAAGKDLQALTGMADPDVFADEVFGFHAQQAAEKILKAWLAWLSIVYPRTHDLSLLLGRLLDEGANVQRWYGLIEYAPYAVQYRYEGFDSMGAGLDRAETVRRLAELMLEVEGMVRREPSDAPPAGSA